MSARKTAVICRGMEQVRQRLERWRQTRAPGLALPENLWAAAVKVARQHGVYPTARALGLEYNKLKRLSQSDPPQIASSSPTFVELVAAQPADISRCRIELENARGATLKIELPMASAELVVGLCRLMWEGKA
jgi:hypothetical protein